MKRVILVMMVGAVLCTLTGCGLLDGKRQPGWIPVKQMVVCSGCGGSGNGADYLQYQGYPQVAGFSDGPCPRCGGFGKAY
jgi:hypothetical protein